MDTIFIHDLRVDTIIGIYDWERTTLQTVSLDIEMATDIRNAAKTEDINNTPSYKDVAKRLHDFVSESEFFLIETMAEEVACIVLDEFGVESVKITVHKPGAVTTAKDVGVIIERKNEN
ncbi:MAG: dihydroneopterin aldolase [Pseudomonadota bacterium]